MTTCSVDIDASLLKRLVAAQFPAWSGLDVRPVARSGWDNRTFHIGAEMVARLPSASGYALQIEREQRALALLRAHVPLAIPELLARGRPGFGYPWPWSIYKWIPGVCAAQVAPTDDLAFALDLAAFLAALHAAPAVNGPLAGPENFHRGGRLAVYDQQFRHAVEALSGRIDSAAALRLWEQATDTQWHRPAVWVHGDIALGNLLMQDGRLAAVIDFGQVCVGDPACDLAIAWTYFRGAARETFRRSVGLDRDSWRRGQAWALWKAAITAADLAQTNAAEGATCWETLAQVLSDGSRD